jgi:hypothetical protein
MESRTFERASPPLWVHCGELFMQTMNYVLLSICI